MRRMSLHMARGWSSIWPPARRLPDEHRTWLGSRLNRCFWPRPEVGRLSAGAPQPIRA